MFLICAFADVLDKVPSPQRELCGYDEPSFLTYLEGHQTVNLPLVETGFPLACGDWAARFRVDAGSGAIKFVRGNTANGVLAHGGADQMSICNSYMMDCALIDYLMYWALRLYSWVLDGEGTFDDLYVALCCSRAALAQMTEFASTLVHELGHRKAGGHCQNSKGKKFGCCPELGTFFFSAGVTARLGLPQGMFSLMPAASGGKLAFTEVSSASRMLALDIGTPWTLEPTDTSCHGGKGDGPETSGAMYQGAVIQEFMVPGSTGSYLWSIDTLCTDTSMTHYGYGSLL
jgi:hypothetical protein